MFHSACWEHNSQSPEERGVTFDLSEELIVIRLFQLWRTPAVSHAIRLAGPPLDLDTAFTVTSLT